MRDIDLGIERSGERVLHDKKLTVMESKAVAALGEHGKTHYGGFMPAPELAEALGLSLRDVRKLINHLISEHDQPLVPRPGHGGGYRLADSQSDIDAAVAVHLARVRTGMHKISSLRGAGEALAQDMVQLTLDLPGESAAEVHRALGRSLGPVAAPASQEAIKRTLLKYRSDPGRYQAEIDELADAFGGLFVRGSVLASARNALAEVQASLDKAMLGRLAEGA